LELAPVYQRETLQVVGKPPEWSVFQELLDGEMVYHSEIPDYVLNPPSPPPPPPQESMSSRLRKFFGLEKKQD
jgi:hypothetical protein